MSKSKRGKHQYQGKPQAAPDAYSSSEKERVHELMQRAEERAASFGVETPESMEDFARRWAKLEQLAEAADADNGEEGTKLFIEYIHEFYQWMISQGMSVEETNSLFAPMIEKAKELQEYTTNSSTPFATFSAAERLAKNNLQVKLNEEDEGIAFLEPTEQRPRPRIARHGNWHDVVDLQDEMIRFWMSPFGRDYGRAWGINMIKASIEEEKKNPDSEWRPEFMEWAKNLGYIMQVLIQRADPIYINEDVMDLIEASISEFKMESLIREDVFPTFNGLALLPRPYYVTDQRGKRLCFRAIAWETLGPEREIPELYTPVDHSKSPGMLVTGFTHIDDDDDYPMLGATVNGKAVDNVKMPIMSICYVTPWHFDNPMTAKEIHVDPAKLGGDGVSPIDLTGSGLENFCKFCQVMWRIAKQEISEAPRTTLPRAQRKRAERSGLMSDVVVVRLRHTKKPKQNEGDGSSIEYTHRWRVRAHVRNQWYPSLQTHRQIIVPSHIKGPEDAPLIVKPFRAYELTR